MNKSGGRECHRESLRKLNAALPRYCTAEVSRHGKICVYYREVGRTRKIRMREEPLSTEFFERYAELRKGNGISLHPRVEQCSNEAKPHTWRWLCQRYFEHHTFGALAARGQRVRRAMLSATWNEPISPGAVLVFGDCPLSRFTARAVRTLRDRKVTRVQHVSPDGAPFSQRGNLEAANSLLKYMRGVLAFAAEEYPNLVERNWAHDVAYFKTGSQGIHTWTLDEVAQFEARHPVGSKARLAFALALYTGQRRGDLHRLGRHFEKDHLLKFVQEKNCNRKPVTAYVPILPALRRIIDASPTGDLVYLVQANGRPYKKESFGNLFRKWCREAGLPHCSAHGLRKACVVRLITEGCTPHQIMAITGHQTLKEVDRYAREYLRESAALQVYEQWRSEHANVG